MPIVNANGIQIAYDTFGNPSAPPLLMIMGLGGQLIHWNEAFCRQLAQRGSEIDLKRTFMLWTLAGGDRVY